MPAMSDTDVSNKFVPSEPISQHETFLRQLVYLQKAAVFLHECYKDEKEAPAWVEQQVMTAAAAVSMPVKYMKKQQQRKSS